MPEGQGAGQSLGLRFLGVLRSWGQEPEVSLAQETAAARTLHGQRIWQLAQALSCVLVPIPGSTPGPPLPHAPSSAPLFYQPITTSCLSAPVPASTPPLMLFRDVLPSRLSAFPVHIHSVSSLTMSQSLLSFITQSELSFSSESPHTSPMGIILFH